VVATSGDAVPAGDDEARLADYATALADGIDDALPGWVERSVARVMEEHGHGIDPETNAEATRVAQRARDEIGPEVRALLAADIDDQRTNPLAILRRAVAYPTEVLRGAGVPPVERDEFAVAAFPDDVYDLAPAAFADVDESLREPGLLWGAAKAHVHLTRRRAEPT
jgi:hypothetical protein